MGAGITISAAIEAMEKGKSYRLVQRGGAVEALLEQQKRVIIPAAVDGRNPKQPPGMDKSL